MTGAMKGKCEECGDPPRDATVVATLRPLEWDGVGVEPREKQRLCDQCLAKIPIADVVSVWPYHGERGRVTARLLTDPTSKLLRVRRARVRRWLMDHPQAWVGWSSHRGDTAEIASRRERLRLAGCPFVGSSTVVSDADELIAELRHERRLAYVKRVGSGSALG